MPTRQKVILVDSAERNQGTSSSFTVPIKNFPYSYAQEYNRVSVLEVEIPKSYYLFDKDEYYLRLQETTSALDVQIQFPAGGRNYSLTEMATELQTLFNAASALTYIISFNAESGRFQFSNNDGATGEFTITVSDPLFAKYLGFNVAESKVSGLGGSINIIRSVNVVNLQRTGTIRVESNMCLNENDQRLINLFAGNTPDFGLISFIAEDSYRNSRTLTKKQDNNFQFSLRDDTGAELSLNGVDWRMRLVLYREE